MLTWWVSLDKHPQDAHCINTHANYVMLVLVVPLSGVLTYKLRLLFPLWKHHMLYYTWLVNTFFQLLILSVSYLLQLVFLLNLYILPCKVNNDNVVVLTLACLEPQQKSHHSKHNAMNYQWFHMQVFDPSSNISIVKIETENHLGHLLTNCL